MHGQHTRYTQTDRQVNAFNLPESSTTVDTTSGFSEIPTSLFLPVGLYYVDNTMKQPYILLAVAKNNNNMVKA